MPQATYRGRNTLTLRERGYVVERSEAGTAKICTMLNVFLSFSPFPGFRPPNVQCLNILCTVSAGRNRPRMKFDGKMFQGELDRIYWKEED